MEKLVQGDQDKTEQLQHLKNENGQLFLSLTEQVESCQKTTFSGISKKIYIVLSLLTLGKISEEASLYKVLLWLYSATERHTFPSASCLVMVQQVLPPYVCVACICFLNSGIEICVLQREHQKKLEQTVEQMKQKEMTAMKKQQELMACLSLHG
jgi:hypothetical protein